MASRQGVVEALRLAWDSQQLSGGWVGMGIGRAWVENKAVLPPKLCAQVWYVNVWVCVWDLHIVSSSSLVSLSLSSLSLSN